MGGQNLNFVIPSNYIKAWQSNTGAIRPLLSTKFPKGMRSILVDLGRRSSEGVTGENFTYNDLIQTGNYSFSLVNKLRQPVQKIYCLVVLCDLQGNPIDAETISYSGIIAGGFDKRINGQVDESVEKLNSPRLVSFPPRRLRGRIEIRVLDFQAAK